MMRTNQSRRTVAAITVATALAAGAVLLAGPRLLRVEASSDPQRVVTPLDGAAENLLLVIEGFYPTEAEARAAAQRYRFGDVDGLYTAPAANFRLVGAYEKASPDRTTAACNRQRIMCDPAKQREVVLPGDSTVRYAGMDGIPALRDRERRQAAAPGACGQPDGPPCVSPLVRQLVPVGADETVTFALPDGFMAVAGFRTKVGAEQFLELARAADVEHPLVVRARTLVPAEIGLGQEMHPDGSGPLTGPLPDAEVYQ